MVPSLFIAHGAPLLALENNEYTAFLEQLGQRIPTPKAVILFSAHWLAGVQQVSEVSHYDTIYDFGGFPDALYQIKYPASGHRGVAAQIQRLFDDYNIAYAVDRQRGLDHGAWVVLRLLFPNADVPVVSMSVNPRLSPEQQYKIGSALAGLRKDDVLMIGSGGTVHNLSSLRFGADEPEHFATEFDQWLGGRLTEWDLAALWNYDKLAPGAHLAVPPHGNEHLSPIFYAMGAASDAPVATLLHQSYQYGTLSQSVWQFG